MSGVEEGATPAEADVAGVLASGRDLDPYQYVLGSSRSVASSARGDGSLRYSRARRGAVPRFGQEDESSEAQGEPHDVMKSARMSELPGTQRLLRLQIVKDLADVFEQVCHLHFGRQRKEFGDEIQRMHKAHEAMLGQLRSIDSSLTKLEAAEATKVQQQKHHHEQMQRTIANFRKQQELEDGTVEEFEEVKTDEDERPVGFAQELEAKIDDDESEDSKAREQEPSPPTLWRRAQDFIEGGHVAAISSAVILANAVQIGLESELMITCARTRPGEGTGCAQSPVMTISHYVFYVFYTLECTAKMVIHGRHFYFGPDRAWNLFDLLLVLSGSFDLIEAHLLSSDSGLNLTWLRMLRLPKMLKMLRVVRLMESFKELRVMLASMVGAVRITFWALGTLAATMFFFSICFLQGLAGLLGETPDVPAHLVDIVDRRFSSLGMSMESLFLAVTGGILWEELKVCLAAAGRLYYLLLFGFMGFTLFALLNVINGICCSAAAAIEQRDYEALVHEVLGKSDELVAQLKAKLTGLDGDASWDEMVTQLQDEDAVRFMGALSIDKGDALRLFRLLQRSHGTSRVPVNDFIDSCVKLKGGAKSIDVVCLMTMVAQLTKDVKRSNARVSEFLARLDGQLTAKGGKRGNMVDTSVV